MSAPAGMGRVFAAPRPPATEFPQHTAAERRADATVHAADLIEFNVTAVWQDGDGRLAGVTGEAEVTAFLNGVFEGASASYTDEGFLIFP